MIQRIQTVYLSLGILTLAALGFFGWPWSSEAASTYVWFVPSIIGLTVLTSGTALWSIFLYETREWQRTVVMWVQIGTVLLGATLYGGLYLTSELAVRGPTGVQWGRAVVLVLPLGAYVFFLLARRGIEHDIELVKSMDRLR
ncbi:MAG: DUF4293 domain-containing protein [Bacteroidetes bacterium SW_9_63_38]|nr:MAG: DUF4293 domain-containing protein [Bacteroidetes bacterium SW_9_63_38]